MKKFKIISIITIGLVFIGTSCTKEFLEPKPLSFYAPENTFINAEGLNAALLACNRNIMWEYYGDGNPLITECIFSDCAVEGTTDKTGPAMDLPAQILPDAELNSSNYNRIGWYWVQGYAKVKYASVVINRINDAEYASDAERNNVLGKAYFHRARAYYMLTQQFGDVPLILNEIQEPTLDFYSCTRVSILLKIKKDLDFAAKWVKTEAETGIVGDVTRATVNQLLTKVNLATGNFDDAIASASAIIDDGYHHLMTERFGAFKDDPTKDVIWDLHSEANRSLPENREKIYNIISREDLIESDASSRSSLMRNVVPFWGGGIKTPTGKSGLTDYSTEKVLGGARVEIDQVTLYGRGIGRCRQTPYHHTDIWTDSNDKRHNKSNWRNMEDLVYNDPRLKVAGDPWYGKNIQLYDDNGTILCSDTIRQWYGWPYYKFRMADPTQTLRPSGGCADWYLYRLAETYLLRAEAYFWKDQLQQAATDINAVRTRAGCAPFTASDVNIGTILDERARELFYEEPRKTEITRIAFILAQTGKKCYNGKTYSLSNFSENNFWYDRVMEKNIFYKTEAKAPHYNYRAAPWIALWPIPAATINANTKGHINQNQGYPGAENYQLPMKWVDGEGEGEIVAQ